MAAEGRAESRRACRRCGFDLPVEAAFCPACGWRNAPARLSWSHARWWRILIGGYLLFILVSHALTLTQNPFYVPTELVLGSFLIPVCFVYYLYENGTFSQVPVVTLVTVFIVGGVLGTVAAGVLESDIAGLFAVGFIEEASKILGLAWWLNSAELRGEGHGMVVGAAAGMGFASFETMGYAFSALLTPHGISIAAMTAQLMSRGVLSPLGHGTWTAILAGTMWREKAAGRSPFNSTVVWTYVFVSLLHSLWDMTQSSALLWQFSIALPFVQLPVVTLAIGVIGLLVLKRMVERNRGQATASQVP